MNFEKYAAKGNEFLNLLAKELEVPKERAARILRAVFYTLRDHLSIQESLQLIAQLPMILKAIYVDQWDPANISPRIHHVSEFLDEVRRNDRGMAGIDLGNDITATRAVQAVFRILSNYVTEGEFEDIMAVMPREIKELISASIGKDEQRFF